MNIIQRLKQLEDEATAYGFAWPDPYMILEQLSSECQEVGQALQQNESAQRLQEEIGDILHAAFSLCIYLNFDPEETLIQTTEKFAKRFYKLQAYAKKQGYESLKGQSFDVLMKFWNLAKKHNDNH